MLKIWGNEPREHARGGQTTCGHLASPCGRPWAPRAREPSAPVGPTRPPRGADVAPRDLLGNLLLFPPFNQTSFPPTLMQFFEEHLNPASVFQYFCLLVLIISLSYELEIIRFKNQNCWSRRELQTPSISRGS
jgi:hypothetical protein